MKTEILRLLKESDGYLSGQELCDRFQVSRTAVWKVIGQLKDEGYEIEAVRNKGYHLVEIADVMTEAELKTRLKSSWAGSVLEYHYETGSTNNRAKALAEEGYPHGTLVVADFQHAGKGRRGKSWSSPHGTAIYMSMVLRPQVEPSCASMITLVAAMAVAAGIRNITGLNSMIKWPNDIVVHGKKVCGILTEMSAEMDCIHYVVVGIGINVNMTEFPKEIQATATSLRIELGECIKRGAVIAETMKAFELYYERYQRMGSLSLLREEYNGWLANINKEVKVLAASGNYQGVALGIDESGELLVKVSDGTIKKVVSGEVSVRGIYGYV